MNDVDKKHPINTDDYRPSIFNRNNIGDKILVGTTALATIAFIIIYISMAYNIIVNAGILAAIIMLVGVPLGMVFLCYIIGSILYR